MGRIRTINELEEHLRPRLCGDYSAFRRLELTLLSLLPVTCPREAVTFLESAKKYWLAGALSVSELTAERVRLWGVLDSGRFVGPDYDSLRIIVCVLDPGPELTDRNGRFWIFLQMLRETRCDLSESEFVAEALRVVDTRD